MPTTDLTVRLAEVEDLDAVAMLFTRTRAVAAMPPSVHTAADDRAWVASWDLSAREVWLALDPDDRLLGFAYLHDCFLEALYVAPEAAGTGVGSVLLDLVKTRCPDGFELWVFEMNDPARRFYARHGLVVVERTDGSANEEREPDLRLRWQPAPRPATGRPT